MLRTWYVRIRSGWANRYLRIILPDDTDHDTVMRTADQRGTEITGAAYQRVVALGDARSRIGMHHVMRLRVDHDPNVARRHAPARPAKPLVGRPDAEPERDSIDLTLPFED